ncbi:hypothetical protein [Ancylobacter vacuolatus]|uniref:TLP18.3, Psb32 and MOLO-1 founding protein of phosphatase n=1 Tax=Ancylobacter vacuolatus TaxID=223389 RepID=A0ABU0DNL0_9HYPH|nr:hypothetical protein [Ancylobacter vacuolatus]MDQ0350007.1 hypothetical protein [Ancylobacter vacuolatus]
MIGKTVRALVFIAATSASVPVAGILLPTMVQAALSTGEQAALNVVVSAESQASPDAQVAAIMGSSLSGAQKALALQWLAEGAATDAQVVAIAAAIISAVVEAGAAGQTGTVAVLGTGLGQAYKALNGDGRASAAGAVMSAMQNATAEPGAAGGLSRQMSQALTTAFTAAAAGTPRSAADSSGEDAPDPGQTDNPGPTPETPSPS